MKRLFFSLLFLALIWSNCGFAQEILHPELVSKPSATGASVKLFFAQDAEVSLQWSQDSTSFSQQTSWQTAQAGEPVELLLSGLSPNTQYFYRVCHRLPGGSTIQYRPLRRFHTQRPSNQAFTFVVQADPHLDNQSDTSVYLRCLQNQLDDRPDFMIDLGDFLMTDKLKNTQNIIPFDTIPYRCKLLRRYYEKVGHSLPIYNVLGNHEGEAGWFNNNTASNIAVWDAQQRNRYFNNPEPDGFYSGDTSNTPFVGKRKSYFSWHWGDALFIVLDPYWYTKPKPDSLNGWRWTLGKQQYDWLKATLEASTATYKFVFAHQIVGGTAEGRGGAEVSELYEWGGKNLGGNSYGFDTQRPNWYKPIKDLLAEHRVNIFFHGHDHFFGKQQRNCLIYQECPQPSHPNFASVSYADDYGYFEGQILPNSGHIRVRVAPEGVRVEYVRVYKPASETPTRRNKDVSALYVIGPVNCYDSLTSSVPILWNPDYKDELIYPNPTDKGTQLEFSVPVSQNCQVEILDAQGKVVHHLLRPSPIPQGKFVLHWEGQDDTGKRVPTGMYQYRIQMERDGIRSGKIIIQ